MMSSETNMENNRIQILKEILLDLHHGASPESVQELFNQHFKGVSALEISMMEHELMASEDGVTFEDVMSLCNVHANLFKGAIADVEVADADQEGHPVYVFKQENLALRSAILRIRRIIENISKPENEPFKSDLLNGLKHQMTLLGQFHNHYTRKEKLFFPIMERYGHDSPPKVMWGVDDDIRKLFRDAESKLQELSNSDADIEEFSKAFETFLEEFEAMIFKEEAILLMILLETFTQDDWLSIAEESDAYGYAIIKKNSLGQGLRKIPKILESSTLLRVNSLSPSRQNQKINLSQTEKPLSHLVMVTFLLNRLISFLIISLWKSLLLIKMMFSNTTMIMSRRMRWSLNEHLAKLDEMLNFVIHPKYLIRSRKPLTYSEVGNVTKFQCGSSLNV